MITVGLVKELLFIAKHFKKNACAFIGLYELGFVELTVSPEGGLQVQYKGQVIWQEMVETDTSMFGVESCDSISRIITCIDNGTDWSEHAWKDSLDKIPSG